MKKVETEFRPQCIHHMLNLTGYFVDLTQFTLKFITIILFVNNPFLINIKFQIRGLADNVLRAPEV